MELVQKSVWKNGGQRLRRWEAALMAGLAIALLTGVWLDREQAALAEQVVTPTPIGEILVTLQE